MDVLEESVVGFDLDYSFSKSLWSPCQSGHPAWPLVAPEGAKKHLKPPNLLTGCHSFIQDKIGIKHNRKKSKTSSSQSV